MRLTSKILSITMTFVFFLMTTQSIAQEGNQQETAKPAPISNQELQMASEAYVEVLEISGDFQQSLQNAQNPDERTQLQKKANNDMISAVEESGLTLERYNEVMQLVRSDEELAKKFNALLQS